MHSSDPKRPFLFARFVLSSGSQTSDCFYLDFLGISCSPLPPWRTASCSNHPPFVHTPLFPMLLIARLLPLVLYFSPLKVPFSASIREFLLGFRIWPFVFESPLLRIAAPLAALTRTAFALFIRFSSLHSERSSFFKVSLLPSPPRFSYGVDARITEVSFPRPLSSYCASPPAP